MTALTHFSPYALPISFGVFGASLPYLTGLLMRGGCFSLSGVSPAFNLTALLTPGQLNQLLDVMVLSAREQLKKPESLKQLYRFADEVLPQWCADFSTQILNSWIKKLEAGDRKLLTKVADQITTTVIPKLKLNYDQAEFTLDIVFNTLLSPDVLRLMLIKTLTEAQADQLVALLQDQAKGWQGFVLKFVNLKEPIHQFRNFLIDEPERANVLLLSLIDQMELREQLAEELSQFSWVDMPQDYKEAMTGFIERLLTEMIVDHGLVLTDGIKLLGQSASRMLVRALMEWDVLNWVLLNWIRVPHQPLANRLSGYLNLIDVSKLTMDLPVSSQPVHTILRQYQHQVALAYGAFGLFVGWVMMLLLQL